MIDAPVDIAVTQAVTKMVMLSASGSPKLPGSRSSLLKKNWVEPLIWKIK